MSEGQIFCVFKRKRVYYAQFKLASGRWSIAKSTGALTRGKAERWAYDYLSQGKVVHREGVTLGAFSDGFFNWEGTWATDKRARGLRISRRQCQNMTYLLQNFLLPRLASQKLSHIDKAVIRDLRNRLYNEGYAGSTINKVLAALKTILEAAEDASLIQFVPKVERAAVKPTHKGILTIDEVKQLFSMEWRSTATHCHPERPQYTGYVGNLTACATGLRLGELQALVLSDVHLSDGYLFVRRSWCKSFGLNDTTKTGRARTIFIPDIVQGALRRLIEINPDGDNPESFVFFSEKTPGKPAEPAVFYKALFAALARIGITDEIRRARNITFHSWRHFFNSLLVNARVPLQKIQSMTGHLTAEMTQLYYHPDDMEDVKAVQKSIFVN